MEDNIMTLLEGYTLEEFVKCRNQKEWICDQCFKCGDRACCAGTHKMFRVPKTENCLCSNCLQILFPTPIREEILEALPE